ncbi:MAG: C40 family peptidase [Bacteroidales bacterium]|nr:C40 family peptidase [Bacteroidales bacterium]MCF8405936.1 C40 family peptidase [Bacteroidales bacterium]
MNIRLYKLFLVIVLGLALNSCTSRDQNQLISNIEASLDSLKNIYAPDTRVAWWNTSIEESGELILVKAEVDKEDARKDIIKTLENSYHGIETQIICLPEMGNRHLTNGLINNSVANLRSNPWHSAEISTQALLGTPIRILKNQDDWYLIQVPNKYIAWTDSDNIVSIDENELAMYKESEKVIYNNQYGFSYSEPNTNSQVVSDLAIGCILPVTGNAGLFYKVQYPDKREAYVKKSEVVDANLIFNKSLNEDELVKTAMKFMGIPYLWGGTSSKAIDCSGFTSTIYYLNGVVLQRDASQQTKYGNEISTNPDFSGLVAGDLLFFGRKSTDSTTEKVTHVGMYIGNTEFIHASGRVKINSLDSTRENYAERYIHRFVRSVRISGENESFGIQKITNNDFYKEIISN